MTRKKKCLLFLGAMLAITGLASISTLVAGPGGRGGQVSFGAIVAGDPAEYAFYQVKITYTGAQTLPVSTFLLYGSGTSPDVAAFGPFETPAVHYENDRDVVIELEVSASSIERVIWGLEDRPELQVSGGAPGPVLSLMIARPDDPNPPLVFEHLADDGEADTLHDVLYGAVIPEPSATRALIKRFRWWTIGSDAD